MRRLPPLTAIEAFVQVARLGSVKAAASELALSSPALSRRVQSMERFVGRPLFDRRHQAMTLNQEGELLIGRIAPALDMLSDAIETATGDGEIMRLRLSVLPLFASQQLIGGLGELRARHPELHLDIDTQPHGLKRLGDGIDAAIVLARDIDSTLYARQILKGRIQLIGARELIADVPFTPDRMRGMSILIHRDMLDTFETWREAIGMPDLEPAATDYFDSGQLMLDAAVQGLGVAVMFDGHLEGAHDDRLVSLSDAVVESPYSYWFACRRSALSVRAVRMFHDWLIEMMAQRAA